MREGHFLQSQYALVFRNASNEMKLRRVYLYHRFAELSGSLSCENMLTYTFVRYLTISSRSHRTFAERISTLPSVDVAGTQTIRFVSEEGSNTGSKSGSSSITWKV